MKALLKTIGVLIGIVIVLFVAIAIIVPIYFHPNDYKDEIAAAVQDRTGRELKIEGDIGLSVFPWLAIELGKVELGNAPGFSGEKFASLEKMEIGVKLLPLISRRLEMRAVVAHGLELNLARDKDGQTNWADLAALQSPADKHEDDEEEEGKESGRLPLAALGIGGLDIRDAALRWDDAQNDQHYKLEGLAIETGALVSASSGIGEPVDITISFDVEGNRPPISGQVDIGTKLTADVAAGAYQLSELKVLANLAGESLPNGKLALDLQTDIGVDLGQQTLRVDISKLAMGQIDASGVIGVEALLDAPAFAGKLQLATFNPRALLTELGVALPDSADPNVLTSASLSTVIEGTAESVALKPFAIRLDDTALEGQLAVTNFQPPAIRFDLEADAIDVDRYLPPAGTEADEPAPATPGAAATEAVQLPLDALRALDVDGRARMGRLTVAGLNLSDLSLAIQAKDGVIEAHPIEVNLYQGSYLGNVGIDARADRARITLDEKLTGVQVGPLLRDLRGDELLSGRAQFDLDLQMVGATPDDLKKTLNGKADFAFLDGMINGLDIVHAVCDAVGQLTGGAGSGEGPSEGTRFQKLAGNLSITDGRVGIDNTLLLEAPLLRVRGVGGNIDIGANRLNNAQFIVKPAFTCEGQGGRALEELSGADIPITCNGPMEGQSCLPDAEALARIVLGIGNVDVKNIRERAENRLGEALSEQLGGGGGQGAGQGAGGILEDQVRDKIKGRLDGLFGR